MDTNNSNRRSLQVKSGGPRPWSDEVFAELGAPRTAYVRPVTAGQLKAEGVLEAVAPIPDDTILYAVHAANGMRLAVLDTRETAFMAAKQNDLDPVSVH